MKGSLLDLGTPVSSELRNLIICSNTSLEKLLIACHSSTNNVAVIATNAAFNEELILAVLLIFINVNKLNVWVPLSFLEFSRFLGNLLGLRSFFSFGFSSSNLALLNWSRALFVFFLARVLLFLFIILFFIKVLLG